MCPLGHRHQLESGKKGIATGAAADQNGQIWEQPDNIQTDYRKTGRNRPEDDGRCRTTTNQQRNEGRMATVWERLKHGGRATGMAARMRDKWPKRRRRYTAEAGQWRRMATRNPTQQSKSGRRAAARLCAERASDGRGWTMTNRQRRQQKRKQGWMERRRTRPNNSSEGRMAIETTGKPTTERRTVMKTEDDGTVAEMERQPEW